MRIAVFGATGRTGRPLVEQALAAGHEVVAFARDRTSLDERDRLTVVEGDVRDPEPVAAAVEGADAVVSVLGHAEGSPDDVLTVAARNVTAAMERHGVDRLVTLVGAGVRHERDDVSLGGRVMGVLLKALSPAVLEDAEGHAAVVRESGLDWTVVRAGRLTEANPTGRYRTGYIPLGIRDAIPRGDVAAFMLELATGEEYVGEMPTISPRGGG